MRYTDYATSCEQKPEDHILPSRGKERNMKSEIKHWSRSIHRTIMNTINQTVSRIPSQHLHTLKKNPKTQTPFIKFETFKTPYMSNSQCNCW